MGLRIKKLGLRVQLYLLILFPIFLIVKELDDSFGVSVSLAVGFSIALYLERTVNKGKQFIDLRLSDEFSVVSEKCFFDCWDKLGFN